MTDAASLRMRWTCRTRLYMGLLIGLVVTAAGLIPAAASFVPPGNAAVGVVAQAGCKWDGKPGPGALHNVYDEWLFEGEVATNWCYNGRSVTSRSSKPYGGVTNWGAAAGWVLWRAHWAYSACHTYNGIRNHNCLTQRQYSLVNLHGAAHNIASTLGSMATEPTIGGSRRAISAARTDSDHQGEHVTGQEYAEAPSLEEGGR